MVTIFHPSHPHFAVHKAFIEDSFANPDNPPELEQKCNDKWYVKDPRDWFITHEYRIKPRTFTRMLTYAEPLRKAPEHGTEVWLVQPNYLKPHKANWSDCYQGQLEMLKNGMVFTTEADAWSCYNAIFGEQKCQFFTKTTGIGRT